MLLTPTHHRGINAFTEVILGKPYTVNHKCGHLFKCFSSFLWLHHFGWCFHARNWKRVSSHTQWKFIFVSHKGGSQVGDPGWSVGDPGSFNTLLRSPWCAALPLGRMPAGSGPGKADCTSLSLANQVSTHLQLRLENVVCTWAAVCPAKSWKLLLRKWRKWILSSN